MCQSTRFGWHFLRSGNEMINGKIAPADGVWLHHDGPITPCKAGLHASERLIDALRHTSMITGSILTRVELQGNIVEHGFPFDKIVGRRRRILWRLDEATTEDFLHRFARWAALQVAGIWDAPPVVWSYLESGNRTLVKLVRDEAYATMRNGYQDRLTSDARLHAATATWEATRPMGSRAANHAAHNAILALMGARANEAELVAYRVANTNNFNDYLEWRAKEAHLEAAR